jgi:hypothetical protein
MKSFPEITQIGCVRRGRNGTIWSASGLDTDTSLWRSSGNSFTRVPVPAGDGQPIVALEGDRNNDPWIYTRNGLTYRMHSGTWLNENKELGKKLAVLGAMTSANTGDIWFAFSNRLVQWDGTSYSKFSFPDGSRNALVSVLEIGREFKAARPSCTACPNQRARLSMARRILAGSVEGSRALSATILLP